MGAGESVGGYAVTVNIPPFFSVPIEHGKLDRMALDRRQPDGRPEVALEAVADVNETLLVSFANERRRQKRAQLEAERKQRTQGKRGRR